MTRQGPPLPKSFCANCGDPVSNAGTPPKRRTRRFCSKRECQAAKARANYHARPKVQATGQAPTRCANPDCPMPELPPRPARASDDPLGRWCKRVACRAHRARVHGEFTPEVFVEFKTKAEVAELSIQMLADAIIADDPDFFTQNRVKCPVCHLDQALEMWPHPDAGGGRCEGTVIEADYLGRRLLASAVWGAYPRRTYTPPEES